MEPQRAAARGGARQLRVLPGAARDRPRAGSSIGRQGLAVPPAAVRVLRRLRGLRRDAVRQAAHAALRRPPAHRQRHRLLVDLRRQPADDALHAPTPTGAARPGPTRSSRTTPSSASASGWRSTSTRSRRASCSQAGSGRLGDDAGRRRCSKPTRPPRPASPRSASASSTLQPNARAASPIAEATLLLDAGRLPGEEERLDRRRRRLGLRHRLRRPRPRPRRRPQRQHPGARHRGLLQHRRPGLQGHAARRGRQVRGGRQGRCPRRTSA